MGKWVNCQVIVFYHSSFMALNMFMLFREQEQNIT